MKRVINTQARKDIRQLKEYKNDFIKDTLSTADIKKKLGISYKKIANIPSVTKFGLTRYYAVDVSNYYLTEFMQSGISDINNQLPKMSKEEYNYYEQI